MTTPDIDDETLARLPYAFEFNLAEINRLGEWYNALTDLSPSYLQPEDHELGEHLKVQVEACWPT